MEVGEPPELHGFSSRNGSEEVDPRRLPLNPSSPLMQGILLQELAILLSQTLKRHAIGGGSSLLDAAQ